MIFDKIENLKLYSAFNSHFDDMAKFIEENDFAALPCGSYDVGNGVKVNIAEYEPSGNDKFEAHRDYHDVQYAICGNETIEVIPTSEAKDSSGYKPDIEFFTAQNCESTCVALEAGTFVFLAPQDAHKPCVKLTSDKIKKAVFKIPV